MYYFDFAEPFSQLLSDRAVGTAVNGLVWQYKAKDGVRGKVLQYSPQNLGRLLYKLRVIFILLNVGKILERRVAKNYPRIPQRRDELGRIGRARENILVRQSPSIGVRKIGQHET